MFQKGNTESVKGGKKRSRILKKELGSDKKVSAHFRKLRLLRKKKRLENLKQNEIKT